MFLSIILLNSLVKLCLVLVSGAFSVLSFMLAVSLAFTILSTTSFNSFRPSCVSFSPFIVKKLSDIFLFTANNLAFLRVLVNPNVLFCIDPINLELNIRPKLEYICFVFIL